MTAVPHTGLGRGAGEVSVGRRDIGAQGGRGDVVGGRATCSQPRRRRQRERGSPCDGRSCLRYVTAEEPCAAAAVSSRTRSARPWERWITSCRTELLHRTLIYNEQHLLHVLCQYEQHDDAHRTHRGLAAAAPERALPEPVDLEQVRHPPSRPTRRHPPRKHRGRLTWTWFSARTVRIVLGAG